MLPTTRPLWRAFFIPFPCGGSSGVLSGLFFGGILFHPAILSSCVGLLATSWNRRHAIKLLQGRYKPCTGRFPGVARCTTSGILCRPGQRGGQWRHRPMRSGVAVQVGRPADLGWNLQDGRGRGFLARYGRAGRAG